MTNQISKPALDPKCPEAQRTIGLLKDSNLLHTGIVEDFGDTWIEEHWKQCPRCQKYAKVETLFDSIVDEIQERTADCDLNEEEYLELQQRFLEYFELQVAAG